MFKKLIILTIICTNLGLIYPSFSYAKEVEKDSSYKITLVKYSPKDREKEEKIAKLRNFLKDYNSPLTAYVHILVEKAEENDIDWRLVTAISGVESTFGKAIPTGSYNAYGWANGDHYFQSWEDGITTVTETLNRVYKKKWHATDPYQIGKYYAASPTWAQRVNYFMEKIGQETSLGDINDLSELALSL